MTRPGTPRTILVRRGRREVVCLMVKPIRILIVEDHENLREAIVSQFEPHPDFAVVGQAASLEQARSMLAGVDLVLLDLGLPDGCGLELLPELRAASPGVLVLVLSAAYDPAMGETVIERGASAYLDKVVHLSKVAEITRRILSDGRP